MATPKGQFHSRIGQQVLDLRRANQSFYHTCDPVAMMVAIDNTAVMETERKYVAVELTGSHTRGHTVFFRNQSKHYAKEPNVEHVIKIDIHAFKEVLMQMVS